MVLFVIMKYDREGVESEKFRHYFGKVTVAITIAITVTVTTIIVIPPLPP